MTCSDVADEQWQPFGSGDLVCLTIIFALVTLVIDIHVLFMQYCKHQVTCQSCPSHNIDIISFADVSWSVRSAGENVWQPGDW